MKKINDEDFFIEHDRLENQIRFNILVHNMSKRNLLASFPVGSFVQWYEYERLKSGTIAGKLNDVFQIKTVDRFGNSTTLSMDPLFLAKNLGALKWVPRFT